MCGWWKDGAPCVAGDGSWEGGVALGAGVASGVAVLTEESEHTPAIA